MTFIDLEYSIDENWQNLSKPSEHENTNDSNFRSGKILHSKVYYIVFVWEGLGLGTHLFAKVPWPGDSKVSFSVFESSCHLLLPV